MATPVIPIKGNLAYEPEFKKLPNGNLLKFRVITNDKVEVSPGKWEDKNTTGWNIEVWGKLADTTYPILKKGMGVMILANMRESSYEGSDGKKVYRTDYKAVDIAVDVYSVNKISSPVNAATNMGNDVWDTSTWSSDTKVPF